MKTVTQQQPKRSDDRLDMFWADTKAEFVAIRSEFAAIRSEMKELTARIDKLDHTILYGVIGLSAAIITGPQDLLGLIASWL